MALLLWRIKSHTAATKTSIYCKKNTRELFYISVIFIPSRFHPVLCQNLKEMFEGGEEKSEQPVIIRHHDKRSLCLRNVKVKLFLCKLVMCVNICAYVYICKYIYIYTCIHISIPTLRPPLISIRCKWRCPWCIYRQRGNWSTRQASRGAGRRAGMWSSSSCFITAQTVRTRLKISLIFFWKQPLLTAVHHRCRVVDGGAASVSPERVWEFATGWARPGQALGPGCWSAAITWRCRAGQVSHNHPLGRPAVLCSRSAEEAARWRFAIILVRFYTAELC